MPLKRRHARIPAAIALLAVAAFALLWAGARTPYVRGLIADAITDVTGLPARVGRLRLGFIPSPRLDIGGLAVAQPPGFGDESLLEVERHRGRAALAQDLRRDGSHQRPDGLERDGTPAGLRRRHEQLVEAFSGTAPTSRGAGRTGTLVDRCARPRGRHDRLSRCRDRHARAADGHHGEGERRRAGRRVSARAAARRHRRPEHDPLRAEGRGPDRPRRRAL